jgi:hypothetical protein
LGEDAMADDKGVCKLGKRMHLQIMGEDLRFGLSGDTDFWSGFPAYEGRSKNCFDSWLRV